MKEHIKSLSTFINENAANDPYKVRAFIASPEFAQILAMGYKLTSTERQLKNGTLAILAENGITLFFMAATKYIRKLTPGADRLQAIFQFGDMELDEFWNLCADRILNQIYYKTSNLNSASKKDSKTNIKTEIANYIDQLGLSNDTSTLLKKNITYNNINVIIFQLLKELTNTIFVDEGMLKVKVKTPDQLKINYSNIIEAYKGPLKMQLCFVRDYVNKRDLNIVKSKSDIIEYGLGQTNEVSFYPESETTQRVLSWGSQYKNKNNTIRIDIYGKTIEYTLKSPPIPKGFHIDVKFFGSKDATLIIETDASSLETVSTMENCIIRSNADPNKVMVITSGVNSDAVPYHQQFKLKLQNLDGSEVDDHSIDIDMQRTMENLW